MAPFTCPALRKQSRLWHSLALPFLGRSLGRQISCPQDLLQLFPTQCERWDIYHQPQRTLQSGVEAAMKLNMPWEFFYHKIVPTSSLASSQLSSGSQEGSVRRMEKLPTSSVRPSTSCGQTISFSPFILTLQSADGVEEGAGTIVTFPRLQSILKWIHEEIDLRDIS